MTDTLTKDKREALERLLERVEEANGPDRELDARIAVAFGDIEMRTGKHGIAFFHAPVQPGDWAFLSGCTRGEDEAFVSLGSCSSTEEYTASVDAALALVERELPGWVWTLCAFRHDTEKPWADVASKRFVNDEEGSDHEYADSSGATPPLAILAALLSAKLQCGREGE